MAGSGGNGMGAEQSNFRAAFMASPGPNTPREAVLLWLKGVCMGGADIIPGVSGGTIAFITGIYSQLVDAIRSFDTLFVRRLLRLDLTGALAEVHARFLACLLFGILTAVVTMAGVMNYMLNNHPVEIWSLFFGLIAASIFVVGREIKPLNGVNMGFVLLGTVGSYLLVGMLPVSTPETPAFIFLCGSIAICAMILPGISGAFPPAHAGQIRIRDQDPQKSVPVGQLRGYRDLRRRSGCRYRLVFQGVALPCSAGGTRPRSAC